jgi:hypothetical protein
VASDEGFCQSAGVAKVSPEPAMRPWGRGDQGEPVSWVPRCPGGPGWSRPIHEPPDGQSNSSATQQQDETQAGRRCRSESDGFIGIVRKRSCHCHRVATRTALEAGGLPWVDRGLWRRRTLESGRPARSSASQSRATVAVTPVAAPWTIASRGRRRGAAPVTPGLTDVWAWHPDGDAMVTTTDFMRILGGVARKG